MDLPETDIRQPDYAGRQRSTPVSLASLASLLLVVAGCASNTGPASQTRWAAAAPANPEQCQRWFDSLDAQVTRAKRTDAEFERIKGFPYLRVNRHWQRVGAQSVTEHQRAEWINELRTLDEIARATELANLPERHFRDLLPQAQSAAPGKRQAVTELASRCGKLLVERDLSDSERQATLIRTVKVPDRYASGMRAIGLYPLASIGVSAGVKRWEQETRKRFSDLTSQQAWPRYETKRTVLPDELAPDMADLPLNSLGVPQLDEAQQQKLLNAYAPVYLLEQVAPSDQPGEIEFDSQGLPTVNTRAPTLYQRLSFTRYRGRSLVQLVYTLWFSAREATSKVDIYAGRLDGVIIRVTLDTNGQPAVVDTIHPCGCYHQFFANIDVGLRDRPASIGERDEWRFMPGTPLIPGDGRRLHVAIEAGTHYVAGINYQKESAPQPARTVMLQARAERTLTRLNQPVRQATRSLYDVDGLVSGTDRGERWLLWPMGISRAGAMRQWGHHATAFVGRRHFDDADLIESRFILP